MTRNRIATCLWFDHGQARAAAEFYGTVFPNSRVGVGHASPSDADSVAVAVAEKRTTELAGHPAEDIHGDMARA